MNQIIFIALMLAFILSVMMPTANLGITGLTPQNIVVYLSFTVLAMQILMGNTEAKKRLPNLGMAIGLVFVMLFSMTYAGLTFDFPVPFIEVIRRAKALVFDPLIIYVLVFMLVKNSKDGRNYLMAYVIALGILNVMTLVAAALNLDLFRTIEFYKDQSRFVGIAGNPNKTAYVLCVAIPFQYYFYKSSRGLISYLLVALMALEVLSIVFTGSRGGMLTLLIVVVAMARMYKDYKRLIILPAMMLPLLVVYLLAKESLYITETASRLTTMSTGDASTASQGRFDIWAALWVEYTSSISNILVGLGFGTAEFIGVKARAHNLYMEVLVEFGIIGLIAWLFYLTGLFAKVKQLGRYGERKLKTSVTLSMAVVCIGWVFTTIIGVLDLISLVISLGAVMLKRQGQEKIAGIYAKRRSSKNTAQEASQVQEK